MRHAGQDRSWTPTWGTRVISVLGAVALAGVAAMVGPVGKSTPPTALAARARGTTRAAASPFHKIQGGFKTTDKVSGLAATFTKKGVTLKSTNKGARWTSTIQPVSFGRSTFRTLHPVGPKLSAKNLVYSFKGGVTEIFANGVGGLQQEFFFTQQPLGDTNTPAALNLHVGGALAPVATQSATGVLLEQGSSPILTYGELGTSDASGYPAITSFAISGRTVTLRLQDDPGMNYPHPLTWPLSTDLGFTAQKVLDPQANAGDYFGQSTALSAEGSIALVGATGAGGGTAQDPSTGYGVADVFVRTGSGFSKIQTLQPGDLVKGGCFGQSAALSADGSTAAVSAPDCSAGTAGRVYVFSRSGASFTQVAELGGPNADAIPNFGASLALSADGSLLFVGSNYYHTVSVYRRSGGSYSLLQEVDELVNGYDIGGDSLSVSGDGHTLVVGSSKEPANNQAGAGVAFIFEWTGSGYGNPSMIQEDSPEPYDYFGSSVALSQNGQVLAVGAPAHWFGRNPSNTNGNGTVFVFQRSGSTYVLQQGSDVSPPDGTIIWNQPDYVQGGDMFGDSVAINATGSIIVAGASWHSNHYCVDGNCYQGPGSVYVITHNPFGWNAVNEVQPYDVNPTQSCVTGRCSAFGTSVAVSESGTLMAVGAPQPVYGSGAMYAFPTPAFREVPRFGSWPAEPQYP